MNRFRIPVLVLIGLLILAGTTLCSETDKPFGLKPPGLKPEKFAPGIVSTDDNHEYSCTISPDGKEFYFTRANTDLGLQAIFCTKYENGKIGKSFAIAQPKDFGNFEPFITPDGKKMIFQSWCPLPADIEGQPPDVWYIEKKGDSWGEAKHFGSPYKPRTYMYTSASQKGNIYSAIMMEGTIVKSEFKNGKYSEFEKLDSPINTESPEQYPFIAPDESYIIFNSNRQKTETSSNLYISYRTENNIWGEPQMIETGIENCNMGIISPCGSYLFFTHKGDIYWVSSKILKK